MIYLEGLPAFLTWFPLGVGLLIAFLILYARITPWREVHLIRMGNVTAALSFLGALLGYAVVLASILAHAHSRADFIVWSVIGLIVQLMVLPFARLVFGPGLREAIEQDKIAIGVTLGGMALGAGLINASAMVP
ncbi:MAG: DUF350 domain-containing protein [Rhodocyclaceae bacterium]|jgi:putative membrane protein|nr:DUF350 domain-containing protein [Rhodocyclaceae bacterium]